MSEFSDIINEWVEETEVNIDNSLRTVVLLIGKSVVTLSPVDTGRFKGNWRLSIDQTIDNSILRYDQTGDQVLNDFARTVNRFTAGQMAYIQNHVLYGYDLEYGSSTQAPDGMVRVTMTTDNLIRIVNEAVRLNV